MTPAARAGIVASMPTTELNYDRPRADWFDADGRPILKAERFDYRELLPSPDPSPTRTGD
jgi:hypothetical protein